MLHTKFQGSPPIGSGYVSHYGHMTWMILQMIILSSVPHMFQGNRPRDSAEQVFLRFLRQHIPGCLRSGLSWFNWWVSFAPEFQCCYFCESSCLFYLSFNSDFYASKIMHL